jgi:hypothetical protein
VAFTRAGGKHSIDRNANVNQFHASIDRGD